MNRAIVLVTSFIIIGSLSGATIVAAEPVATNNNSVTVTLEANSSTTSYEENSTYKFDIIIQNNSDDMGAYDITINSSDESTVTFESFRAAPDGAFNESFLSNSNATIRIAGIFFENSKASQETARIGTVTVKTHTSGLASLDPSVSSLTNFTGDSYTISGTPAIDVTVGDGPSAPTLPGVDSPATDTDGDGNLDDVNGDESFTAADVTLLFSQRNSDAVQNNAAAFDFNGDSSFNAADITFLFRELIG